MNERSCPTGWTGRKRHGMFERLMIAFCYFELFLLIASVIVLVVAAMVLTEQDKQSNAKKGGGQL